jgi:hypothetical protein
MSSVFNNLEAENINRVPLPGYCCALQRGVFMYTKSGYGKNKRKFGRRRKDGDDARHRAG